MSNDLHVYSLTLGPLQANCFVLARGEQALVIDPGDEPSEVVRLVARRALKPGAILLTHGHFDHFGAAETLAQTWDVPVYVGREDAEEIARPALGAWAGMRVAAVSADPVLLDGEQTLDLAVPLLAIPTPGHSPGSYTFHTDGHLFSGDLIFAGSVGRTDLPGGSSRTLIESIVHLVQRFPATTVVHCGHGPDTSLERELKVNPFFAPIRRAMEGR